MAEKPLAPKLVCYSCELYLKAEKLIIQHRNHVRERGFEQLGAALLDLDDIALRRDVRPDSYFSHFPGPEY